MPVHEMSESHRRGIATALALLDETLCTFQHWAEGHEARGVLYEEHNSLPPRERENILSEIEEARRVLQDLREKLHLPPRVQDVATAIWAWSYSLLEPLQELEGRYLGRYGEPPADLVAYLDPRVAELCRRLGSIRGIASRLRARPDRPGPPRRRDGGRPDARGKRQRSGEQDP